MNNKIIFNKELLIISSSGCICEVPLRSEPLASRVSDRAGQGTNVVLKGYKEYLRSLKLIFEIEEEERCINDT